MHIHKQPVRFFPFAYVETGLRCFSDLNRRGSISVGILLVIVMSMSVYVSSVYRAFSLGFEIQKISREISEINDKKITTELDIHKRETSFAEVHPEVFQSMEKIAAITYLISKNVAMKK